MNAPSDAGNPGAGKPKAQPITVRCAWCQCILGQFVAVSASPGSAVKIKFMHVCKNRKCISRKSHEPNIFIIDASDKRQKP
jgi:hypothetical protein